jgi:hypothetical protein
MKAYERNNRQSVKQIDGCNEKWVALLSRVDEDRLTKLATKQRDRPGEI